MPTKHLFGHMPGGQAVHRTTLENGDLRVRVLEFGAALQSIELPAGDGSWTNVALGLQTLEDYVAHSPHFGAVPGRYAGRIAHGRFTLDGQTYRLPADDSGNTLHGGPQGFGKRPWTFLGLDSTSATLGLTSPDGDAGFPGAVQARVTYSLHGSALHIDLHAETDRSTIVNLTNHTYFNLAGEGAGDILGHELCVEADTFLPIGADQIPTGERRPVAGTPFDFRTPHPIGRDIRQADSQLMHGLGYDHAYLIRGSGLRPAARLRDPRSGRTLAVHTTQPALQVYTGNSLKASLAGPSGRIYRQSDAVCLEAQHPADGPNHPGFPSTVLRPGAPFAQRIVFQFGHSGGSAADATGNGLA